MRAGTRVNAEQVSKQNKSKVSWATGQLFRVPANSWNPLPMPLQLLYSPLKTDYSVNHWSENRSYHNS